LKKYDGALDDKKRPPVKNTTGEIYCDLGYNQVMTFNFTLSFILLVVTSLAKAAISESCREAILNKTIIGRPKEIHHVPEISSIRDLREAVTSGMEFLPDQNDLFRVYRMLSYPHPFAKGHTTTLTYIDKTAKKSELKRRIEFPEVIIPMTWDHSSELVVRQLSYQESYFRSEIAGDCSTSSYGEISFNSKYLYFTLTDQAFRSFGQVTVVLGEALDHETGVVRPIALVDKIQAIPLELLAPTLAAIGQAVTSKGFNFAFINSDYGFDVGLSMHGRIRNYVTTEIFPLLKGSYAPFQLSLTSPIIQFGYSRAGTNPTIQILNPNDLYPLKTLKPGRRYARYKAPPDLSLRSIVESFKALNNEHDFEALKLYTSSFDTAKALAELNLLDLNEYVGHLRKIAGDPAIPTNIKLRTFSSLISLNQDSIPNLIESFFSQLTQSERMGIALEVGRWRNSLNDGKRNTYERLQEAWFRTIGTGDLTTLQGLFATGIFDANFKNISGQTSLTVATYAKQDIIIKWLTKNGASSMDAQDQTNKASREIEQKKKSDQIEFINLNAAEFMASTPKPRTIKVKKGFSVAVRKVTRAQWNTIGELATKYLDKTSIKERTDKKPHHPQNKVSFIDVNQWLLELNSLSLLKQEKVHLKLAKLINGYKPGSQFRLPSSEEWELAARANGAIIGDYTLAKSYELNGKIVSDFVDGTSEWVGTGNVPDQEFLDYLTKDQFKHVKIRGGVSEQSEGLTSFDESTLYAKKHNKATGFRMVISQ
jgi:hypothetical protein